MVLLRSSFGVFLLCAMLSGCASSGSSDFSCKADNGLYLLSNEQIEDAYRWWSGLADHEYPQALVGLDILSEWGFGRKGGALSRVVPPEEIRQVLEDWRWCALNESNSGAQILLGMIHYTDLAGRVDLSSSKEYFSQARESGHPLALLGLSAISAELGDEDESHKLLIDLVDASAYVDHYVVGYYFFNGLIFDQDYNEAAKWFRISADLGDVRAQGVLGYLYTVGLGVPKDSIKADYWFSRQEENPDFEPEEKKIEHDPGLESFIRDVLETPPDLDR